MVILCLFFSFTMEAQVDEEETDSVKTGVDLGQIQLPNPQSITSAYTYDPVTDRYIYTSTMDGFNINYPIILTPKEYEELLARESMREYFQKKLDAMDGKKEGSEEAKKDLLPRYYVNSGLFETIFGGNTIDVKPTGSVEMDLGIRFTKQDNPAFSPRNRKSLTFDFDQRISLSLQGKVGTRLMVNANYDTQSTFAFQNLIKLEYTPTEDDIIRKIEVGNVSFPLNSSLIRGAQSLFGAKMQLQFGKTTFTGVFSEQKSQTKSVTAQGGGTLQDFEMFALDYDADRHYFLSQYFRNKYDEALKTYPIISSRAQITRIEVWVTNKQNRINATDNNLRNIIALQDLGEAPLTNSAGQDITREAVGVDDQNVPNFYDGTPFNTPSQNQNNLFDPAFIATGGGLLNASVRDIATAGAGFNPPVVMVEGQDYAKLENARKLTANEFTYHPQLGYISLNQRLANDEVLAVAFQYTIGDDIYQVGEFGTDGVDATQVSSGIPTTQSLILKMLKSSLSAVNQRAPDTDLTQPTWNLMMKNIYQIPGAYQLTQEDFRFNIVYTDPSPLNYINLVSPLPVPDEVTNTPLLKVFNLDKLNYTNDPQEGGDGFFDFIQGMTVDTQNGRLIFTTVEPFGELLFEKLRSNAGEDYDIVAAYNANQTKYVFRNLYKKTQALALQDSEKNKFQLKGKFKSTGGDGISIGAFNVPQGSVVVTAGGRVLVEGIDYTVDYQRGRVQILDPSLQASNTPIEVSVENNSVFGQQTRRFYGLNVEHKFNDKFQIGGTFLRMSEKPFTQKSNYGQESVNNTIFGLNGNFSTEIPFFTRMVNKLPNLDTDVPSNLSVRGEIAYLLPGNSKNDQFNGESTVYIDDFEGSQSTIDMRAPQAWSLASTPIGFGGEKPENDLTYNDLRAKISWYTIDPVFYVDSQRPSGITEADLRSNRVRRIYSEELYPNTDIAQGQSTVVSTLDLTYYPEERGPYNFSAVADPTTNTLPNPTDNWGGIMRAINSTNFEQANVEYVQFWMMDPFYGQNPDDTTPITNVGKLTINLGEISEDVLKDGRKLYENGLPEVGSSLPTYTTNWGKIPAAQSLIYAFDADGGNREVQDLGLNGLTDSEEAVKYPDFAVNPDPAADNYDYYLNASGSVIERYRSYNGVEGNSPVELSDNNRGSTTLPDVEDINRDNTMNTINAYYKFEIPILPNPVIGQNYVVDTRVNDNVPIANGTTKVRWVLYKIPIFDATAANTEGSISDFRSIRFMRMFLSEFQNEVTLRFGSLDLVRGEWRRYLSSMDTDPDNTNDDTGFDITTLNIQENGSRSPIPYVMPPGVDREQLNNNNSIINQNEQSLSLKVYSKNGLPTDPSGGLEENDARAAFKNVSVDMRQFKKLRMFLHAESLPVVSADNPNGETDPIGDDEMVAFLRFGNDFTQNFYQIEIPLKVSAQNSRTAEEIWPEENEIELPLELLTKLKILALQNSLPPDDDLTDGIQFVDEAFLGSAANKLTLGIKGNPNFGLVRTIMVGLKNRDAVGPIRGEVWFNELRMSDMDNKGGWAAVANMDTNFADFANISATGRKSTIGFGGLEEGPNERSREDVFQYNVVTNVNLGKLLPKKWGIQLPFNYGVGEETVTPKYDPFYQDIELEQLLDITEDEAEKSNIKNRAIDYTKRTSINFIGVKKDRGPEQKQHVYDVENLTLSHSFNEMLHHDFQIQSLIDQQVRSSADYAYTFKPKVVEPFKQTKFMKKSSYWKLLSDFNFSYLPTNISFSTNILRQFNRQEFRQVDVEGIGLDPLYRRNYLFNYNYGFNYNLTKSLRFNYTVATNNLVRNYLDENKRPIDELTIWDDYFNIGEANLHTQQLVVNYDLPINKIPALSFIKSTYSYNSNFTWQRSSDALSSIEHTNGVVYSLGNTIQNSGSHKLNTTFSLDQLYKYIGLTGTKKAAKPVAKPATPKPGQKLAAQPTNTANERGLFYDRMIGILTSLKTLQVNYAQNEGTMLPGYLQNIGFLGTSKPTVGFVLGSQADVRYEAAKNGWLTYYPEFNQNFTQVKNKTLNITGQMEVLPDLKIDLSADRALSQNYSEQYDVDSNGDYHPRSPYDFGNYSMTTILIKTAFSQSDENMSAAFNDFRENRLIIANRLAEGRGIDLSNPLNIDAEGYPKGFGKNSQAVLLPAFYAAYTGTDASNVKTGPFRDIPLPNWNVKYTGFMRYQWFKDTFKRFSLQHGYRASYTINSFRSNFEYDRNPNPDVSSGTVNFPVKTIISNVNLVEQFNPLIRLDFEMKNSFKILAEMKKDRALSLSFDNNLLTEVKGNEYIAGLGYRFKDVTFSTTLADDPSGVIKSDLNLKADVSFRQNKTIVRYLDYDNNQLGGGQNIWSIKFTADYAFSKNLTAIFYYDHSFSKAVISTTFPITNIRSGFTLRYNFGN
nr:cell surface protein SprA [uncultured Flavobacterium sp.]